MSIDISKMPKLGFGMMRLPQNENKEIDLPQVCRMVDTYMKAGFNYFDTAYMYCDGRSESVVKEAVVKRYPRESFWLTTTASESRWPSACTATCLLTQEEKRAAARAAAARINA